MASSSRASLRALRSGRAHVGSMPQIWLFIYGDLTVTASIRALMAVELDKEFGLLERDETRWMEGHSEFRNTQGHSQAWETVQGFIWCSMNDWPPRTLPLIQISERRKRSMHERMSGDRQRAERAGWPLAQSPIALICPQSYFAWLHCIPVRS